MKGRLTATLALAILWSAALSAQELFRVPFPAPESVPDDTLEVMIIGDVMMHAPQMKADCSTFLANIAPALRDADVAVANMEFSLGGEPFTGYPAFSAPDYIAPYVADCGVDIFLTANNHILDRRSSGLTRTLDIYRSMKDSVLFTGSASSLEEHYAVNPLMVLRKGLRIALVNFTYGTNGIRVKGWPNTCYQNRDSVRAAISRAKRHNADFIVALPHWGDEYSLKHSAQQQQLAEWLVSEGVDIIVGGHPHVVQDTTHISGVPVIYSMGNAVSNMSKENTRLELAVRLKFVKNSLSGEKELLEPELLPMWCTLPGRLCGSYATIFINEWATRRSEWLIPYDFDDMAATWERVRKATGIGR